MRLFPIVVAVVVWSATSVHSSSIPSEVKRLVPTEINIDAPKYADARRELNALVKRCGAGVVKGAVDDHGRALSNSCTFEVKLDELFFTPLRDKTGLLHDPEWAWQDGETWYVPRDVVDVPAAFDIRDLMKGGQPVIKKQKCGDCWAWSTHHGLELARAVYEQKAYDHAVQAVLSCSDDGSCSGGYMTAPTWLVNRGLPYETQFPYKGTDVKCPYTKAQMDVGWDGSIYAAPNVGSSLDHSRYFKGRGRPDREGSQVKNIIAAMYQSKAPVVVTVSAYDISGDGIYNSCSNINSQGNHMVAIVGWDSDSGARNAHVWNSWGPAHGKDGVSRIKWECGDGKLDRGLGVSARVIQYVTPCELPKLDDLKATHLVRDGGHVHLGKKMARGIECKWLPTQGLADPNSCETDATPSISTEYHLQASGTCGTVSSMSLVEVFNAENTAENKRLLTPFGETQFDD